MQSLECRTPSLQSLPTQMAPANRSGKATHMHFPETRPSRLHRSLQRTQSADGRVTARSRTQNNPYQHGPLWRPPLVEIERVWQLQLRGPRVSRVKSVPEKQDSSLALHGTCKNPSAPRGKPSPASLPTAKAPSAHSRLR